MVRYLDLWIELTATDVYQTYIRVWTPKYL